MNHKLRLLLLNYHFVLGLYLSIVHLHQINLHYCSMDQIQFKKRGVDEIVTENVPGGGFLKFLYGGNVLGKFSLFVLVKRKYFSWLFGKYMDSKYSKNKIAPFVAKHQINLEEYEQPEDGYQTFNEFFYRKIKPEFRPIQEGVVTPADGRVLAFEKIDATTQFFVKGSAFSVSSFLADSSLAKKYENGAMFIVRLAPVDYHRYHFPVDGIAGKNIKIKGNYYSVSPFALRKSLEIFCQNKREYCIQKSDDYGDVLICDVGATLTGGIVQTYPENQNVKKGDEKGYFAFGGSTLVLLFEPNKIRFSEDIIENTKNGYETFLKMGETIGSLDA